MNAREALKTEADIVKLIVETAKINAGP